VNLHYLNILKNTNDYECFCFSNLNRLRLRRAVKLLSGPETKIAAAAAEFGFESLSHFHRLFKRHYGLTPAQYRRSKGTLL